jgi:hypothetical protein
MSLEGLVATEGSLTNEVRRTGGRDMFMENLFSLD